jgi:acetamidase/formamidase
MGTYGNPHRTRIVEVVQVAEHVLERGKVHYKWDNSLAPAMEIALYLPVFVPGAMFSAGDCHAAQGDGEVCVTGIECPMAFSLRFDVKKDRSVKPWRYHFVTPPGPLQPRSDDKGCFAATALGPDLMENARNAVREIIDWLVAEKDLSREDAYVLCSLAADLKISQIVDQPNFGVSAYLALSVFLS